MRATNKTTKWKTTNKNFSSKWKMTQKFKMEDTQKIQKGRRQKKL